MARLCAKRGRWLPDSRRTSRLQLMVRGPTQCKRRQAEPSQCPSSLSLHPRPRGMCPSYRHRRARHRSRAAAPTLKAGTSRAAGAPCCPQRDGLCVRPQPSSRVAAGASTAESRFRSTRAPPYAPLRSSLVASRAARRAHTSTSRFCPAPGRHGRSARTAAPPRSLLCAPASSICCTPRSTARTCIRSHLRRSLRPFPHPPHRAILRCRRRLRHRRRHHPPLRPCLRHRCRLDRRHRRRHHLGCRHHRRRHLGRPRPGRLGSRHWRRLQRLRATLGATVSSLPSALWATILMAMLACGYGWRLCCRCPHRL